MYAKQRWTVLQYQFSRDIDTLMIHLVNACMLLYYTYCVFNIHHQQLLCNRVLHAVCWQLYNIASRKLLHRILSEDECGYDWLHYTLSSLHHSVALCSAVHCGDSTRSRDIWCMAKVTERESALRRMDGQMHGQTLRLATILSFHVQSYYYYEYGQLLFIRFFSLLTMPPATLCIYFHYIEYWWIAVSAKTLPCQLVSCHCSANSFEWIYSFRWILFVYVRPQIYWILWKRFTFTTNCA